MSEGPRLILGDCLVEMAGIEDGSVDLIAADLPYQVTECKWDIIIPFGPLWAHYRRVLKPRGAVVLTASQPFTSMLVMSNRGWFKYCLVWDKGLGVGCQAHRAPIKKHEDIVVFSPATAGNGSARLMTYNPQGLRACDRRYTRLEGGDRKVHKAGRTAVLRTIHQTSTGFPGSVIAIPPDGASTARLHPTQKPVALMEYIIRTYSNEGETVLDNVMGSGTTGVACLNTGRRFIGIEKDPAYFTMASRRLESVTASTPLFAADA